MPVIKVWGLRNNTEQDLMAIRNDVRRVVLQIPELRLKNENSVTVLFPKDLMLYGFGRNVIIEIILFESSERTDEVLNRLAADVGKIVQSGWVPQDTKVECWVQTFNRARGFWALPS